MNCGASGVVGWCVVCTVVTLVSSGESSDASTLHNRSSLATLLCLTSFSTLGLSAAYLLPTTDKVKAASKVFVVPERLSLINRTIRYDTTRQALS